MSQQTRAITQQLLAGDGVPALVIEAAGGVMPLRLFRSFDEGLSWATNLLGKPRRHKKNHVETKDAIYGGPDLYTWRVDWEKLYDEWYSEDEETGDEIYNLDSTFAHLLKSAYFGCGEPGDLYLALLPYDSAFNCFDLD